MALGVPRNMTTTPQEPDPDERALGPHEGDPNASPIPGEKRTPAADPDDPEYEHESRQRIEGGEPT
jgi:hypothetical protein